ncbi:hypothetical protein F2P81_019869 [Scophthalmus maximus]|uniref:Uncharacterized protein n=1 Tax=Scophthalmus maximus TaxID=52904 RepID=A0A6A4S4L6_SCOMX|nr:hypothetical protein F2P81_019869 [Scophthalmus maximus]
MQNRAGMSDDTAVTLSDIPKFEAQPNCKIVVLFRTDAKRTLSKFPLKPEKEYSEKLIFYNYETYLDAKGVHVPFLVCTKTLDDLNYQGGVCVHDDEARALTGVWVTPEFNKALEHGYRLVRTLLKDSGVNLHRSNLNQTVLVSEPEEFFGYMFSEKYNVKYFAFINDETAPIQWSHGSRYIAPPNKTDNVFIAAFITAYGRLTVYSYLQQLQDRVLYFDTDSLIYVSKEGESQLKLGNYLGGLTDELKGDSIIEFAAAGPKSYAYMRVKGITQTHECGRRMNAVNAFILTASKSWWRGLYKTTPQKLYLKPLSTTLNAIKRAFF